MSKQIERRMIAAAELRASEGDEPSIMGYAASFNILSQDLGGFREQIAPGAFKNSLANGADVRCLFNHDSSRVLGRRSAGTLQVEEDSRGLKFACTLDPANTDHMNLRASILRGDITQCSFAFSVPDGGDVWDEATDENGQRFQRRTLRNVDLAEISSVTFPAYSAPGATVVAARHAGAGDATVEQKREWLRIAQEDWDRTERASSIGRLLLRDFKLTAPEQRGNQDWFSARAAEMCSAMGLDYCDHDNEYIYAADPDDDNEQNCYRFDYECGDDGKPEIDEDSRTAVNHDISHSERGRKVLAERRQRRKDAAHRQHMRNLRGIHSGV